MKAWLDGKKSIIGCVAIGIATALFAGDVIDEQVYLGLLAPIAAFTGIAFRLAQKKGSK